jgi:branched-chain amino acid transport system ATP-binding protein
MLQVIDIHTYYGESHVLHGVSLEVPDSSVVALMGRNGMGKTTTIHSIIGLVPPRRGKIQFLSNDIAGLPPYAIAKMGIGLVPQGRRIFPSLTVKENILIGTRNRGSGQTWNLDRIYEAFPILKDRASHRGNHLSGGEQQMLSIARALMTNPKLLLMDEPTEGLAPLLVHEIGQIIKQLKASGLSILLVEQNLTLTLGLADYVYIMSNGAIVYHSTPEELKNNDAVKAQLLGV